MTSSRGRNLPGKWRALVGALCSTVLTLYLVLTVLLGWKALVPWVTILLIVVFGLGAVLNWTVFVRRVRSEKADSAE